MPRLAPSAALTAVIDSIRAGHLPGPVPGGAPASGVVVRDEVGYSVVLGGRHPIRVATETGARIQAMLTDESSSPAGMLALHAMGLWDSSPCRTTAGAHSAAEVAESIFLGRRVAATRRYSGTTEAAGAAARTRIEVRGSGALSSLVRESLDWNLSSSVDADRVIRLVIGELPDPVSPDPQLPVNLTPEGLVIGPWIEAGELPCPTCVCRWVGTLTPTPSSAASHLRLAAGMVSLEVATALTGTGRGPRPGTAVIHPVPVHDVQGTSRLIAVPPAADCRSCTSRFARPNDQVTSWLTDILGSSAPTRRWSDPAQHEVHFASTALSAQHTATSGQRCSADAFLAGTLGVEVAGGVISRAAASAGNLGAATLLRVDEGEVRQLRWDGDDPENKRQVITARTTVLPADVGGQYRIAVDLRRLRSKYGAGAPELALSEAGAFLGHCLWVAQRSGHRLSVRSEEWRCSQRGDWLLGAGFDLTEAPLSCSNLVGARPRSTRAVRWQTGDEAPVREALQQAERALAMADHLQVQWHLVVGEQVCELVHQRDIAGTAALVVATVDLARLSSSPDGLDRARHHAAAVASYAQLRTAEAGIRGSLVHGVSAVATCRYLDVGLADATAVLGWVVGRDRAE